MDRDSETHRREAEAAARTSDKKIGSRRAGNAAKAAVLAATIAATIVVGGCVVGPDFQVPPAPNVDTYLPDGARSDGVVTSPSPGAHLPADWWHLFGSSRLSGLVENGLQANADLGAAEAALRAAEATTMAIRGGLWPTVQAKWDSSRQLEATRTLSSNNADGKSIYSLHTPQLTVSYVADVFGGIRRQVEAADSQAESLLYQREAVAVTVSSNIALAAIQQASFQGQFEATERLIGVQTELLRILKRQQQAGQIAEPDVLVQETALAQAKLLLPPLRRQRDQQANLLATLTGRFPTQIDRTPFKLTSFRLPRNVPVSLPADLVRQRPDIKAAEANLRAANAQIGVALAARFPQFTLTGNGGSTADLVSRLFSPGTWFWMIAGGAVQTVFDGRTLQYRQLAAEETFVQQTSQYKGVVLTAVQSVADVLVALEADAKLVVAARQAEEAASRSLDLIRKQLEQGQVSLPTLLNAQQAYLQTSLARVQAQASRLANTVALYQALGGGWWNRPAAVAVEVAKPQQQ